MWLILGKININMLSFFLFFLYTESRKWAIFHFCHQLIQSTEVFPVLDFLFRIWNISYFNNTSIIYESRSLSVKAEYPVKCNTGIKWLEWIDNFRKIKNTFTSPSFGRNRTSYWFDFNHMSTIHHQCRKLLSKSVDGEK
jgi:hypothetical protein